jgi:iron-sulfur cluster assembly accessory protein
MHKLFRSFNSISKNIVHVSENAWNKMQNIHKQTKHTTFLFSANSGGCSGLNFNFKNVTPLIITEMSKDTKLPLSFLDNCGLKVYIDPLSEMYLLGTTIDYIYEDYSKGIYESKFTFNPDNTIAGTCGCGISFYIKD